MTAPTGRLLTGCTRPDDGRLLSARLTDCGDPDRAPARFAFAHGMVILELDDRFPPAADLAAAWARGLSAFAP